LQLLLGVAFFSLRKIGLERRILVLPSGALLALW
jgi:hypothetical protein